MLRGFSASLLESRRRSALVFSLSLGAAGVGALYWTMESSSAAASSLDTTLGRRPIVIVGPSGVGKGTLIGRLMQEMPTSFAHSISHTTRGPRPGESHGKSYYFVTREEFEKLRGLGGFYEWNEYSKNLYGTSKEEVHRLQRAGKCVVFDVDVNGAQNLKNAGIEPKPRFVFILPPGDDPLAVLRSRLEGRGTETDASMQRRLNLAKEELDWLKKPAFWDKVIVNDEIERSFAEFKKYALEEH